MLMIVDTLKQAHSGQVGSILDKLDQSWES